MTPEEFHQRLRELKSQNYMSINGIGLEIQLAIKGIAQEKQTTKLYRIKHQIDRLRTIR